MIIKWKCELYNDLSNDPAVIVKLCPGGIDNDDSFIMSIDPSGLSGEDMRKEIKETKEQLKAKFLKFMECTELETILIEESNSEKITIGD